MPEKGGPNPSRKKKGGRQSFRRALEADQKNRGQQKRKERGKTNLTIFMRGEGREKVRNPTMSAQRRVTVKTGKEERRANYKKILLFRRHKPGGKGKKGTSSAVQRL